MAGDMALVIIGEQLGVVVMAIVVGEVQGWLALVEAMVLVGFGLLIVSS